MHAPVPSLMLTITLWPGASTELPRMSSSQDLRLVFDAWKLFTVTLLALMMRTRRSCAAAVSGIKKQTRWSTQ